MPHGAPASARRISRTLPVSSRPTRPCALRSPARSWPSWSDAARALKVFTPTLQLLLQLLEEPPVRALGDDLLGSGLDPEDWGSCPITRARSARGESCRHR